MPLAFFPILLGLTLALAACAPAAPVASPAAEAAALRALVESRVAQGFSGVVLFEQNKEMRLFDGFGSLAGREVGRSDRFWIASVAKTFIVAAILDLDRRGLLSLDDPLSRFFPDAPADKRFITVRQLLSHTSGIGQSYVSEGKASRAEAVAAMLAEPLAGLPGGAFLYSNSNSALAAAVVEIASGEPYDVYVARLWDRIGLSDTGFAGRETTPTVAPIAGALPPRLRGRSWGGQGGYSTAADLARWTRALRSSDLLGAAASAELFAPVVRIGEGQAALGWFLGTSPAGRPMLFVRGNEDFGANALVYLYPESDVLVVILTHAGEAPDGRSWSRALLADIEAHLGL